ncbi:MAG: M23 family metallopeptidase [Clostridium butyricum]|nr:M23 family metallopeptidase [Clostridium butyricum]
MNKKFKQRLRDLLKKEGFYIALFLCLCIMATVGTISYKMLSKNNIDNAQDNLNNEVTLNIDRENKDIASTEIPNAERVENTVEPSIDQENESKPEEKSDKSSTSVATTAVVKFLNPVEGVESRTYTYPNPVQIEENIFRTIRGVNIDAKIGTDVKSAAEGIVSIVENAGVEEGIVVEVKHANGLKTRYGNLDVNVSVKEGDKVNAGQVIGKVGNTAKVFEEEVFGQFLNLQVIDANGNQVNPEKYFELKAE